MKMQQILIIEDDISLNKGLCQALSSEDRQIFSCTNLQAARQQLACFKASLILLDITLPDGSGLDFLVEVKTDFPDIPVILLTANDTDFDIVSCLELGADDYITKPFSLAVLRARVNTQLRKHPICNSQTANSIITIDNFSFDFVHLTFLVLGKPVELSKTEQKLLSLLVENRGNIMTRDVLTDRIWTDGSNMWITMHFPLLSKGSVINLTLLIIYIPSMASVINGTKNKKKVTIPQNT